MRSGGLPFVFAIVSGACVPRYEDNPPLEGRYSLELVDVARSTLPEDPCPATLDGLAVGERGSLVLALLGNRQYSGTLAFDLASIGGDMTIGGFYEHTSGSQGDASMCRLSASRSDVGLPGCSTSWQISVDLGCCDEGQRSTVTRLYGTGAACPDLGPDGLCSDAFEAVTTYLGE